jgi:glycosyltransferase involved in cell wall biosynthesis
LKILFYTVFYPGIGGMESNAEMLANEWAKVGVHVTIVTRVQANHQNDERQFPYPIIRNPQPMDFLRLVRECDVFLQNGLSLRGIWPLLILRRTFVVRHGIWYDGKNKCRALLKRIACRFAVNISNCQAVARELPVPSRVIYNSYDEQTFHSNYGIERHKDLVFVGRLVIAKGADTLLTALAQLKSWGFKPTLTVIGEGPEQRTLESETARMNLQSQVAFVGRRERPEVARLLCEHKIIIVPSRHEPFGNVAVEGIACGCAVIVAAVGGLPEAIGPCGLTFQKENAQDLARKIEMVLANNELGKQLLASAQAHLGNRRPQQVAAQYMEVFQQAAGKNRIKKATAGQQATDTI